MSTPKHGALLLAALGSAAAGTVHLGTAADIGKCLGFDRHHGKLLVEDCLDGKGRHWDWSVDEAPNGGPLKVHDGAAVLCADGAALKLGPCVAASPTQTGWSWSLDDMAIKHGGRCLSIAPGTFEVRLEDCRLARMNVREDTPEWTEDRDQNDYGSPAEQSWVLMPTERPQVDLLDRLQFPIRTHGRYVVDSTGRRVKLVGVNWVGAHLEAITNHGLNYVRLVDIAKYIRHMGFNHVRLNYALEILHKPGEKLGPHSSPMPTNPEGLLSANPELIGLTTLEIFDRCVEALTNEGLLVILNNHMSDGGWCCSDRDGNGLWYNDNYSEEEWIEGLAFVAERYKNNPRVIGHDLRNEVRPDLREERDYITIPWWGGATDLLKILGVKIVDWRSAASKAAVAVWKAAPETNAIVEGVWYASNLAFLDRFPLLLAQECLNSRIFYSLHEYPWYSFVYTLWEYLSNPFNWWNVAGDLRRFNEGSEFEIGPVPAAPWVQSSDCGVPPWNQPYERYVETRLEAGWRFVKDGQKPVWTGEFGSAHRGSWYNSTLRFYEELDADWCWWLFDMYKLPDNWDPKRIDGIQDSYALLNTNQADWLPKYKAVTAWKLQDLIAIMRPRGPEMLPAPEECHFNFEENYAASQRESNFFTFLSTIHWSWYGLLFSLLAFLVLLLLVLLCIAPCAFWYWLRHKKSAGNEEARPLLVLGSKVGEPAETA